MSANDSTIPRFYDRDFAGLRDDISASLKKHSQNCSYLKQIQQHFLFWLDMCSFLHHRYYFFKVNSGFSV